MRIKTDVVIVGTGVAGMFSALKLPRDKKIVIITKEDMRSSDSFLAQGGICVLRDENDYDSYFEDTKKMTKQSLLNMLLENSKYTLPENFKNTTAKVVVMVGKKEYKIMKQSGEIIHKSAKNSTFIEIDNCGHGISILLPEKYLEILNELLAK